MRNGKDTRIKSAGLPLVTAAAFILAAGMIAFCASRPAEATPQFAQKTGKPCGQCHTSPSGGALNAFGKKFKANGDKLPKK